MNASFASHRRAIARTLTAAVGLATVACADGTVPASPTGADAPAFAAAAGAASVDGDWIVLLDDTTADAPGRSRDIVSRRGGTLKRTYQHAVKGFSARMSDAEAQALARQPGVRRVERDAIAHTTESVTPASWGLDRIDQRGLPLDNSYSFATSGTGVRVYIIDTGILTSHQEFGGRAVGGYTAYSDGYGSSDCNGHGTHVAGTVGGSSTGVARGVTLVAVRVLDCTGYGSWSNIIAGIDWVTAQKKSVPSIPAVANMSIGGSVSASVNDAVQRAIDAGVVMAVAAGNDNTDACTKSPASAPNALTVGATESSDARAYYSNFGTCVDLFAPGSSIYSAYASSPTSYATMSGTSMATPHVAGVAALVLGVNPAYSPAQVRQVLIDSGTANVVVNPGTGSPNELLNTAFGTTTVTSPPPPDTTAKTPAPAPAPVNIVLSVSKTKQGKNNAANLNWSGATTSNVDIYRNGSRLTTTANDKQYTDNKLGRGTWTYVVCNAGSKTDCSTSASITY